MASKRPKQQTNEPLAKRWCHTKVNVNRFFYAWKIENFIECCEDKLTSSKFTCTDDDKLEWCLELYPQKNTLEGIIVAVDLHLVSTNVSEVSAKLKVSIIDSESREVVMKDSGKYYKYSMRIPTCSYHLEKRENLLKDRKRLIPSDHLTLHCTGTIYRDLETNSGTGDMPLPETSRTSEHMAVPVPECSLSDDFGLLFENRNYSDVVLFAKNEEFKAHKLILKVRSPVFNAMFAHEMEENQKSRVDIRDLRPAVLKEMLYYIYTGTAPNLHKMAEELLEAADKYMLDRLKRMCEEYLSSNMTHNNAANILVLADTHSADELKISASKYIKKNINDVMKTLGWKAMVQNYPHLMENILSVRE